MTATTTTTIAAEHDRAASTNDSGEDESTVHTDDDEFSDFISSQWKDGVEVGLEIQYPLLFTNYLAGTASATAAVVGRSIEVGSGDDKYHSNDNEETDPTQTLSQLTLSTVLQEGSIAPLFDGTQWAGTRVWKAAILGLEYLLREREQERQASPGSLLELGCGLGVPGMVWKQILQHQQQQKYQQQHQPSPRVVLTDRDSLVPQLKANLEANFRDDPSIEATALDWSKEGILALLQREQEQHAPPMEATPNPAVFDICLNCDCVYEPLYGREAWESLADVLSEVAVVSPSTLLVTALERRNGDNVEGFLAKLEASGNVQTPIERVVRHDEDPHHVIEIYVTRGKSASSKH